MSASKLSTLFFTVALIDKMTNPVKGMSRQCMKAQERLKIGFDSVGKGALSIGTGFAALNTFTEPARNLSKALGEVRSLWTSESDLEKLSLASKSFAMQMGGDAAEIVRSAYDIQSAIPGLAEGALATFTTSAAILAKATKADTGVITSYYGTMYNIFSETADKMGQEEWINRLAGRTAEAVRIFKTTGPQMEAAFSRLGSAAQMKGGDKTEQMGILGTLQRTMGEALGGITDKTAGSLSLR